MNKNGYLYKDKENRRASPGWKLVLNSEFFFFKVINQKVTNRAPDLETK